MRKYFELVKIVGKLNRKWIFQFTLDRCPQFRDWSFCFVLFCFFFFICDKGPPFCESLEDFQTDLPVYPYYYF